MIVGRASFSKRYWAQLAGLFFLLFAGLTVPVIAGRTIGLDSRISRAVEGADRRWLDLLLGWATEAAMPLLLLLVVPIAWCLVQRRIHFGLLMLGSAAGSFALNLALKLALRHNPPSGGLGRPIDWRSSPLAIAQQISDSYSYPSGHVATAIVALGLWLLWLWPLVPRAARIALVVAALGFAALLSYSRIYLGHHVASDIAGGILIGGMWLAGTIGLAAKTPGASAEC